MKAGFSEAADDDIARGFAFLEFVELGITDEGTGAGAACYNKCQYGEQEGAHDVFLVNDVVEIDNTLNSAALLRVPQRASGFDTGSQACMN